MFCYGYTVLVFINYLDSKVLVQISWILWKNEGGPLSVPDLHWRSTTGELSVKWKSRYTFPKIHWYVTGFIPTAG